MRKNVQCFLTTNVLRIFYTLNESDSKCARKEVNNNEYSGFCLIHLKLMNMMNTKDHLLNTDDEVPVAGPF